MFKAELIERVARFRKTEDDPTRQPMNRWRSHAHLLYGNWVNEIYQTTPYDLNKIGS